MLDKAADELWYQGQPTRLRIPVEIYKPTNKVGFFGADPVPIDDIPKQFGAVFFLDCLLKLSGHSSVFKSFWKAA